MYMRLVQMRIKSDAFLEMREFYEKEVIPDLQQFHGSRSAILIQNVQQANECLSMTVWDDQVSAERYGKSELFQKLLDEVKPYLTDSQEWKVQLSSELTLEYVPLVEEPVVRAFSIEAQKNGATYRQETLRMMFVRVVVPKIRQGMLNEFKQIYTDEVIPALYSVKGCLYAYLTEGGDENHEVLSVTIWNNRQDAQDYERSGKFDQLQEKLKHTFSDLYQWKMRLEEDAGTKVVTSEDLSVKSYQVVIGKSFT